MHKRVRWGFVLLAALATAAALALPAAADPAFNSVQSHNGNRTDPAVNHPERPEWSVAVAADTHLGFLLTGDDTPDFASPVASVRRGPGAVRAQIEILRLAVAPPPAANRGTVNDLFVSKASGARDNTPTGCARIIDANTTNLYDERAPKDGECENAGQQVGNTLNSDVDYPGNVALVVGFGDWQDLGACPAGTLVATRVFLSVRWADNSFTRHTIRTNNATAC